MKISEHIRPTSTCPSRSVHTLVPRVGNFRGGNSFILMMNLLWDRHQNFRKHPPHLHLPIAVSSHIDATKRPLLEYTSFDFFRVSEFSGFGVCGIWSLWGFGVFGFRAFGFFGFRVSGSRGFGASARPCSRSCGRWRGCAALRAPAAAPAPPKKKPNAESSGQKTAQERTV